jgi:integrase
VAAFATLQYAAASIRRHVGNLEPRMLARRAYLDRRTCDEVSDGTIRREVSALRAALAWAQREQWIDAAPYVEMPPRPAPRERWLTKEEVDQLIRSASSPHMRLFVALAYHTAARAGAILDLEWDRVDLERKLITYDRPGRQQSRKRRAIVPINKVALAELQSARMVAVSDYVIEFRGKPVASIKTGFRAACRRAECSPHVLRHSSATHLVMAGIPMIEIARMLGDTVAMVEQVYGKHSPSFLRNAADALAGNVSATLSDLSRAPQGNPRRQTA